MVVSHGTSLHYEVTGDSRTTLLFMPTWTIVHKRLWKAQVPYLSRHFRVLTYDGPGNGGSDRPFTPEVYDHSAQVGHALAVLDATGTDRAVVVGLSQGAAWALQLAAEHPERVLGTILVCPSLDVTDGHPERLVARDAAELPRSAVSALQQDPVDHWAKAEPDYIRRNYEDFLWFFFGMCFPEPHSTKQIEDCVGWGLDTTAEVLITEGDGTRPDRRSIETWCRSLTAPVLAIHGSSDRISPPSRSARLAELTGGTYVRLEGSGHLPVARDPVRINLLIREFARSVG